MRRLRELNDQIARGVAKGQPAAAPDEKTLNIALDIANWLPEIAAESDMPEKPWNEVNARSAALVADYQAILSGTAADADPAAATTPARRSRTSRPCSPPPTRWFAGPEKHGTAP